MAETTTQPTFTREQIRKAWVAALRSGEFKQTQAALHVELDYLNAYCCLGVACEVYDRFNPDARLVREKMSDGSVRFSGFSGCLPRAVIDAFGLVDEDGGICDDAEKLEAGRWVESTLAELNDAGASFAQIADVIESRAADLFVDEPAEGSVAP